MKTKSVWYCSDCGHKQARWSGQCGSCNSWNTMNEEQELSEKNTARTQVSAKKQSEPLRLADITTRPLPRISSNLKEFDRLIGEGLVPGSLTLLGGEPGIGKSTMLLQLGASLASKGSSVLYVTGEESLEQTALRAKRMGIQNNNILFLSEIEVQEIIKQVEEIKPNILIIDSIQIVYRGDLPNSPGSVTQVREATFSFMQLAKTYDIATFLIGHVTKSGDIAGPKILEHLVDTVLYFEGDKQNNLRILRVVKNRFGPTDEVAIFQMNTKGLQEVANPSQIFMEERNRGTIGSCVVSTMEGTRPILIEVQSLVTDTFYTTPSRRSTGLDLNRVSLLLAVLEKRARFQLGRSDVFVAATGGFHVQEPASDLGVIMAIASSFCNRPVEHSTLVIGEVGLGGEIRGVSRLESRIKEGIQMGFTRCIVPKRNLKNGPITELSDKIKIHGVEWVDEAIQEILK